jgi:DNA-binding IscR family transcriptional regulator
VIRPIAASGQAGAVIGWLEAHTGQPASVGQIAAGARTSPATVRRVLAELDAAGLLLTVERWPRGYYLRRSR